MGTLYCKKHNNKVKKIRFNGQDIEYCPACKKWEIFNLLGYDVYHKEVERFHNSDARIKVCWAPRRTTKSYSAAHDLLPLCLLPDTICWIVGPSYSLAEKEFRVIHNKLVVHRNKLGIDKPVTCLTNPRSGQLYIKWPWGAILECKSADRPEGLLGEATDGILYSEAAQLNSTIRERYTMQTTVTRQGIELIPTTPFQSAEWVYDLCLKGQDSAYKGLIESFHWDISANPLYIKSEFDNAKRLWGENSPMFREQYLGDWVFYGGSVYPIFNEKDHIIEPFDIPPYWPVVRAIDFGARDPFVCLWAAVGPHSELYFIKEYYFSEGGRSTKIHAQFIKEMSKGMNIILTVGDPSAMQSIEDLNWEGIPIQPSNNDMMSGRMRTLDYMTCTPDGPVPFSKKDIEDDSKNHPRLYIFNTLKETLRELRYYRFIERRSKQGDKETTEGDDHAMDAMRYLCMTRPAPFRKRAFYNPNSVSSLIQQLRLRRLTRQRYGLGKPGKVF